MVTDKYLSTLLFLQGLDPESTWAHALSKPLQKLAETFKRRSFSVAGKVTQLLSSKCSNVEPYRQNQSELKDML
jgi:hypothetical protein